ncbi:MAG: tRNA (adenosine(37)-N6)-dimethylallyltransferase MiaA [Dehalococcoidia bacterium]
MTNPPVLFIVGPTASGKTDAAIALAQRFNGEVVNADSRQVYRGMSIGTAKPDATQQALAPHHLIDVVAADEAWSLARFLTTARETIAAIHGRGRLPIVVGGTGQYIWGLVEGWRVPEVPPQKGLRAELEEEAAAVGGDALHQRLASIDPAAASAIDPRNVRRTIRALEVWEVTGERFSAQRDKREPPFLALMFGFDVPRAELHQRIVARIDAMVAQGWVDEVQRLLESGSTPDLPSFSSAGYREMAAHIVGDLTLEQAKDRTRVATNRLARSQAGWFRRTDPRIAWAANQDILSEAVAAALSACMSGCASGT